MKIPLYKQNDYENSETVYYKFQNHYESVRLFVCVNIGGFRPGKFNSDHLHTKIQILEKFKENGINWPSWLPMIP